MPKLASARPKPYESRSKPGFHHGQVTFIGSTTIDLGIRHNNFNFVPAIKGVLADLAPGHQLAWTYGTKKGTVVVQAAKATNATTTTMIAATASLTISFTAIEEAPVTQD